MPEGSDQNPKENTKQKRKIPPKPPLKKEDYEIEEKAGANIEALKAEIESLYLAVEQKEEEISELREANRKQQSEYLRQVAEQDNLRKRLDREKAEFYQYALADVFKEILGILDNFERALEIDGTAENEQSFREGVEMIHRQILDLLGKYDVNPIQAENSVFDPNIHQAFMTEESEDIQSPEISQVFQSGYMIGQRLLRPALVKVTVPKKKTD